MLSKRTFFAVCVAISLAGSGTAGQAGELDVPAPVLEALRGAERYELLSLDPAYYEEVPDDNFHGWRVLGRASIVDVEARNGLNDALRSGAQESDGSAAMCFHPRHGIHLTRADQVTDLVICFECNQVKVFVDAQSSEGFFTTSSPHEVFDNALKEVGLPVAELPEDPDVE